MFPKSARIAAEHVVGVRGKKIFKYWRLRAHMALGGEPFTSTKGFDRTMLRYLPKRPGYFVEAGCNDGFTNSDTFYLEQRLGWSGLLIEPVPQLATMAKRYRRAKVVNAALGAPEKNGQLVTLNFNDSMSRVGGVHTKKWAGLFGANPSTITAPIRTLSDLLGDCPRVDFLSLDVEDYELEVLKGLDLNRHQPSWMIVETYRPAEVLQILEGRYEMVEQLGGGDYLLRLR